MNQRRGWEDETSSRAVNAQPWDPPPGMLKRQCSWCRYSSPHLRTPQSHSARTASPSAAGPRQRTRRSRGGLGIRFTGRSGRQPAMVRAHSRACALSVMPGNRRLCQYQPGQPAATVVAHAGRVLACNRQTTRQIIKSPIRYQENSTRTVVRP